MAKRMIVVVAALLAALAGPARGQAANSAAPASAAAASATPASAAPAAKADPANLGMKVRPAVMGRGGMTGMEMDTSGIPKGVFLPAPEGLGLAAMTAAGVNITWFDLSDWDDSAPTVSTTPSTPAMVARLNARRLAQGPNYTLSLVGKFAVPASMINGGTVDKAVTDNDEDLLGKNPHGFFPYLRQRYEEGKLQPATVFSGNIRLETPGEKATTIKELSGRVFYTVLGKSKVVNLGLTEFKAGAKGTAYGAKVEGYDEKTKRLTLTFSGLPDNIGEFKFYDQDGTVFSSTQYGGQAGGNNLKTLNFYCATAPPATGRVEVEVYEDAKKLAAPFKLENVPLYGRPSKAGA